MSKESGYLFEKVWTIPNVLSFIRILMIPAIAVLMLQDPPRTLIAGILLGISGLTDLFDGKIARKFNQVSELGKMLDPIADKLTSSTLAVVLFIVFFKAENHALHLFSWVFLLFIVKELVMLIGGALMIHFGIRPGAAEIYGKAATMAFYLVMCFILAFGPEVGAFKFWTIPDVLMMALVVIAVIMTFVAFFSYMPGVHKQVKERFSPEGKAKAAAEKAKKD